MSKNHYFISLLIFLFAGCGTSKSLISLKEKAESATLQEDYTIAVESWKQYIGSVTTEEIEGKDFANAANAAYKNGDNDLAVKWYDQARYKNYSDPDMYNSLASIYKKMENVSKELSALEFYSNSFNDTTLEINRRLFDIYFEIESYEKAIAVWKRFSREDQADKGRMENYFLIQKALKNTAVCDSLSQALLKADPENINALDWNAIKYYHLGEERYKREMAVYEKKKTTSQYKKLLKELDLSTEDYKKSLTYFNKLWKTDDGEKYASYMANIYARFGDEKKADYYKGFIKR